MMCCFSQPVISVGNTQIFARTSSHGTQFLVYQMEYSSAHENAMILPLPVSRPVNDESLRFIDLSGYETFFRDLAAGFPYTPPTASLSCADRTITKSVGVRLQVFEVGNYIASFIPTFADFDRVDERFRLPDSAISAMPQYDDYSFAVFQLAEGASKPHPMAFEFPKADGNIFFPTLHIHDGSIHPTEEFDHTLYLQHAGFDSRVSGYANADVEDADTGLIRSKYAAANFCQLGKANGVVDEKLLVHRKMVKGIHRNEDMVFKTAGDPARPTMNLRPLLSYLPWIFGVSLFSWLIMRRNRIRRERLTA